MTDEKFKMVLNSIMMVHTDIMNTLKEIHIDTMNKLKEILDGKKQEECKKIGGKIIKMENYTEQDNGEE